MMRNSTRHLLVSLLFLVVLTTRAVEEPLSPFPLKDVVATAKSRLATAQFTPTGLKREDYLNVISGIANYFQHFQAPDGRIIDPFLHSEVQYSTPCYAWACAALVASGKQTNLLDSGALALDCALTELVEDKAANNHGDFFLFPVMLAYENLRERVPEARRKTWEQKLAAIEPDKCYRDVLVGNHKEVHNWNVVALSGEYLRHQDGFTDLDFVERYLKCQLPWFTATGQYRDPNVPMAYDHFPRHFLAAILHRGYGGEYHALLGELIERAAWTSLLMQSPNGELPTGGRSAQHQWNEAEQCVTYETRAAEKQEAGDAAAASAFKRAAHLALKSIQRWQRPSGELWIVKNRFDPAVRHGFEGYSSHSQYNLLAASMLATAWLFADDTIAESASPADVGGFVFQLPDFHKIFANCGGLYLELDSAADPHYNSTGLIRVHKTGCEPLIGPTDSGAAGEHPWAVGVAWPEGKRWQSLAGLGAKDLIAVTLTTFEATPQRVRFKVRYELQRKGVSAVVENYDLTPQQVTVAVDVEGKIPELRVRFPAFATDGQTPTHIVTESSTVRVELNGSRETFSVQSPAKVDLHPTGSLVPSRNGYFQGIEGAVKGNRVTYTLKPELLK
jgi:hypothetical protein